MQAMKRFYKQVSTDADAAGWVIKLDSRTVRSPAGAVIDLAIIRSCYGGGR